MTPVKLDLDFLIPGAPLVSARAAQALSKGIRAWVAVPRLALECRLGPNEDQVDLQECLWREAGDYAALPDRVARWLACDPASPGLHLLSAFARELAQPDTILHRGIEELFLEHDLPGGAVPGAPSVFLSLPQDRSEAVAVVGRALALLRASPVPPAMAAAIARCFDACDGQADVGNIGVMLGRQVDAIRVNVKRLAPAQVEPFLAAIGWPGDRASAAALFEANVRKVDRVTLALDIGATPLPRIGVECFMDDQPGRDLRWEMVFDELVAEGLWSADKARAFLAAPRDFAPGSTGGRWPDVMVRQSLLRDETEFSSFARRAIHYKIVQSPGGREAKAYLGAGHLWRSLKRDPHSRRWRPQFTRAGTSPLAASPHPPASIARAIDDGVGFLLAAQLQSGLWRDFVTRGVADEWVSAFVATQLCATGEAQARRAACACFDRLLVCERPDGGWGYSWDCPADADSTAWVIRLATALGRNDEPAIAGARALLLDYVRPGGGVTTVNDPGGWARLIGADTDFSFVGWQQDHDCVTAAAAPFLPPESLAYLRRRQRDGRWHGYWWHHDAYPTALAVEALAAHGAADDVERIAAALPHAACWIADREGTTSFDLAFALRIALAGDARELASAATRRLVAQQDADGSWAPGARLRVPMPGAIEPGAASDWLRLDDRAAFTTAAAVGALAMTAAAGLPEPTS